MEEQLQQALVAVKNGEEEQARAILARILKDQPDNVAGWILLSKLAQTEVQKVAFLRKVLELDPDNQYAAVELSILEGAKSAEAPSGPVLVQEEAERVAGEMVDTLAAAEDATGRPPATDLAPAPEAKLPAPEAETAPAAAAPGESAEAAETGAEVGAEAAAPATESTVEMTDDESTQPLQPAAPSLPVSEDPFDYQAQAEGDTLPPWLADDEAVLAQGTPPPAAAGEQTPPPADLPDWLQEEPEQEWVEEKEAETASTAPTAQIEKAESAEGAVVEDLEAAATEASPQPTISGVAVGLGILLLIVFLLFIYTALSLL